ncbi:aminotransferase class III-fold pyridoxal phosphate-dependent enzyme [Bradyrhizobium sp. CCBAU 51765]|uniref:aminotransferase class III-fold pyridoxal phosphate-dependent enzyme n=1 Tax=Bradyrhizobium sp. CCBAU 51765 TaxID=1325102 RepID=UPI00188886EC|nr:aminotransferase class III-fold pyridoxal phosphate-dependent enzyme [Bradyrhizobium sp. CCBAU 51765]QOZ13497.1 diaminobutyrate--2-oxoglutarate transaminase [Bradyrhizobium sp. CCBAU 51765]
MHDLKSLELDDRFDTKASPAILGRARGSIALTVDGRKIIDFYSGGGSLNYGHNNHQIREVILEYLASDAVVNGFKMATSAKLKFVETFRSVVLRERSLPQYRFEFPGPSGANAIDVALEFSRKVTGRQNVVLFTRGHSGVRPESIALGADGLRRPAVDVSQRGLTLVPYDGYLGTVVRTTDYWRRLLLEQYSGVAPPAAILVEAVQRKNGMNVARKEWLRSIQAIAKETGAVLILDDRQMGCGRTGEFFSFEFAGLSPDLVLMSNSLTGCGLPMSMLLIKDEIDHTWPVEHDGTEKNDIAFAAASAAINIYWRDCILSEEVQRMGELVRRRLSAIASYSGSSFSVRGKGLALGFDCQTSEIAEATTRNAFARGLFIERCASVGEVIQFLPALTIDGETLNQGLEIFEEALGRGIKEGLRRSQPE